MDGENTNPENVPAQGPGEVAPEGEAAPAGESA